MQTSVHLIDTNDLATYGLTLPETLADFAALVETLESKDCEETNSAFFQFAMSVAMKCQVNDELKELDWPFKLAGMTEELKHPVWHLALPDDDELFSTLMALVQATAAQCGLLAYYGGLEVAFYPDGRTLPEGLLDAPTDEPEPLPRRKIMEIRKEVAGAFARAVVPLGFVERPLPKKPNSYDKKILVFKKEFDGGEIIFGIELMHESSGYGSLRCDCMASIAFGVELYGTKQYWDNYLRYRERYAGRGQIDMTDRVFDGKEGGGGEF